MMAFWLTKKIIFNRRRSYIDHHQRKERKIIELQINIPLSTPETGRADGRKCNSFLYFECIKSVKVPFSKGLISTNIL